MKLKNIIDNFDFDYTKYVVSKSDLINYSNILKIKFGPQTEEYLLNYGYLGYEAVEFCGINSKQGEKSDMISQTLYLNKYFSSTIGFVVFENISEGVYTLVSSNDMTFTFNSETNTISENHCNLYEYIKRRFDEGF